MRQRPDQTPARVHGTLGIGIQGDDVTVRREQRAIAVAHDEAGVGRAAEKAVELRELAAFALPSHPRPFALIPAALTVKIEKPIAPVPFVQAIHTLDREIEKGAVSFQRCRAVVGKVAEQGEMQMGIAIAEKADLQIVEQSGESRLGVYD